ncbi:response regulator transcription factor [Candidatus Fermentibacterales bacterium]|nr:response regulator transcription factor [Candidatus Fermentibacterales bacterium]
MPATSSARLLIVEDDPELAGLLSEYLGGHGFTVSVLYTGETAVKEILRANPDLVILDLKLPGKDGLQICRELRPLWRGPVLMLTALKEDTDVVVGLEMGADDYVGKPVSPRVLLARVKALLRRGTGDAGAESTLVGDLRIDHSARTVYLRDDRIELTSTEFDLLALLARRAGRVQDRSRLVEELRGIDFNSFDRSVDVLVSRLRKKLGDDPSRPAMIRTVRGVGYVLMRAAEEES